MIKTDLVLHDGVSNVLREFAHSMHVCVPFFVSNCNASPQKGTQLLLDCFEDSVMTSTRVPARDVWKNALE